MQCNPSLLLSVIAKLHFKKKKKRLVKLEAHLRLYHLPGYFVQSLHSVSFVFYETLFYGFLHMSQNS